MEPIWIFRHMAGEGPGFFQEFLERRRIPFRLYAIDRDAPLPGDISGAAGLAFMGGPMSVNDSLPWINHELQLIRQARERDLPVIGHCLGGQLISRAMGGTISPNPVKEVGWHRVNALDSPAARYWLGNDHEDVELFHWHGETFSLPDGVTPFLSSEFCPRQGFSIGNTLALQCHIEMTESMVRDWVTHWADELGEASASVQSATEMLHNLDQRLVRSQALAERIYQTWLQPILDQGKA